MYARFVTHPLMYRPRCLVCADEVTLTSTLASQLLGELIDMDRYPILIHCVDGTHD